MEAMATARLAPCCRRTQLLSCRETKCVGLKSNKAFSDPFRNVFPQSVVGRIGSKRRREEMKNRREFDRYFVVLARRQTEGPSGIDNFENLDMQVFRFTLGIPGFDDNDLPRVVGILFGGLIILNHAFSLSSVTPALLRSEMVGLFLAAVSISLPGINRQLNGGKSSSRVELGQKQVFALGEDLGDAQRQELAWSSYTLLRNTESTACVGPHTQSWLILLVSYGSKVVCARGFWDVLYGDGADLKRSTLVWLDEKLRFSSFDQLQEPFYLPSNADGQLPELIPRGTSSLLVQPFPESQNSGKGGENRGFLLVSSTDAQAYRKKDRMWIAAVAKKLSAALQKELLET